MKKQKGKYTVEHMGKIKIENDFLPQVKDLISSIIRRIMRLEAKQK